MKVRTFFLPFYAVSFFTIIVVMVVWSQTVFCISPWPMFRHDLQHNARSVYPGPDEPVLKWSFQTDGEVYSSPAIGSDDDHQYRSGEHRYQVEPSRTLSRRGNRLCIRNRCHWRGIELGAQRQGGHDAGRRNRSCLDPVRIG